MTQCYCVSVRRACRVVRMARRVHAYRSVRDPRTGLRQRMRELAQIRVRYGYRRIGVLLQREGWSIGPHVLRRVYGEEGLVLRPRRPRRHVTAVRRQRSGIRADAPNVVWAMDFVHDELRDGRRFRALTIVDLHTRECLAVDVGQHLRGEHVVAALDRIRNDRGVPKYLRTDHGSEFISRIVDLWAYQHHVAMDFTRPGKPTDNGHVESFNGRLREECLNTHWFRNIEEAQREIDAWRKDYNETRPHRTLGGLTPNEYAAKAANEGRKLA